ncbi:Na+/H+ antiporter subunit E [Nocardia zapadnayensis]|nr:Na+/H+ antiporter subunit E [Nocardia zapadnayensis]MCX0270695.1 Na+/H+ antiporter subunit E [Nocardia zapadnayensis]
MSRLLNRDNVLRVGILIWLTAVWVALWGRVSVANVLAGAGVGVVIMVALPLPWIPTRGRLRPVPLVKLTAVSIYYALESSLQLAWFAVRPGPPPPSGVLKVQFAFRSDLVMVLCTNLINLIPGTMVLEIDREHCAAYVHVIDVSSAEAVAKFYHTIRVLERLLIDGLERRATPLPPPTGLEVTK